MAGSVLNEHDAHLGAQSRGEFLGMSGNSSWWLLASAGIAILMVIFLWGVLNVPLMPCLAAGLGLCCLPLLYVFALKNDKPAHYDTDFFEAVLVEAGVIEFSFGPRAGRLVSPFGSATARPDEPELVPSRSAQRSSGGAASASASGSPPEAFAPEMDSQPKPRRKPADAETVSTAACERLQEELNNTQDLLEDALMAGAEEAE